MNHLSTPVTLRPLEVSDADVIAGWASDPASCREADWTLELPFSEVHRRVRGLIESPPPDLMRLSLLNRGVLVGYVDLHGAKPRRRELGFLIGPRSRWGRGLDRLVAAAGLEHGFSHLGLHEIWAEALLANRRSVRILCALGIEETAKSDDSESLDEPTHDRQFSIPSQAWAQTPAPHPRR